MIVRHSPVKYSNLEYISDKNEADSNVYNPLL